MLKQKNYPSVLHDDDGVFKDYSFEALSYGRDSFPLPLVAGDDFLYFGKDKEFPMLFIEMGVANATANILTVEYWNGTAWAPMVKLIDDTKGMTRSGAIQFDLPSDWAKNTINSLENNWVRISPSVSLDIGTTIQGINIVFSDDRDLQGIYPGIQNYMTSTETSYILRHETARDDIVQAIRNRGFVKYSEMGMQLDYDAWDFLSYEQVGRWATYLVLKNIFSSLQSKEDGLYKQKAEEYEKAAGDAEVSFYLTLDRNNDGKVQEAESSADISSRRLVRS
mgnify:CR=1 FL=1